MTTGVYFLQNTSIKNISTFHDEIFNEIPKILDQWSFELKMYRVNPNVMTIVNSATKNSNKQHTMYNLTLSYNPSKTINNINDSTIIFNKEPIGTLQKTGISTGSVDSIDTIYQNKMNAIWQLFQTFKGEGGNSYGITSNESKFIIRTINCFLHGGFRGFLIEITCEDEECGEEKIKKLIDKLNLPKNGKLSFGKLKENNSDKNEERRKLGNLAHQYTKALNI